MPGTGLDWALKIDGVTGEFEYAGSFEHILSEFWSLSLGGSGQLMAACRSFLGVLDKARRQRSGDDGLPVVPGRFEGRSSLIVYGVVA